MVLSTANLANAGAASTGGAGVSQIASILAAKQKAYAAFGRGDDAGGRLQLSLIASPGSGAGADRVEMIRDLAEISYWLQNAGKQDRALHVAQLAITEAGADKDKLAGLPQAEAVQITAELEDRVLGDSRKAREDYQAALTLDPNIPAARRRLSHLNAVENEANAKARANDLLWQRAGINPNH